MTTAARPTFDPARGRDSKAPTLQHSSRDVATNKILKYRQPGQGTTDEVNKANLKERLLRAEREHFEKRRKTEGGSLYVEKDEDDALEAENAALREEEEKKRRLLLEKTAELDRDDSDEEESDEEDKNGEKDEEEEEEEDDDDDDDDDDEDDTAELLRELEKIKRERAEEKERQERERQEEEERKREEEALTGNPLLNLSEPKDFNIKRRWDDDVVFKNQARGVDNKPKKRFINDMLRSDFHRKFLSKYVK
ncbi:uncharacterized protein VTP21DRAFT_3000 [Calcarisporiella thermophila]|uniref:uncharacterized protein n=1 Tax=Calcarisporiella thermophila TaxID=911321 RepID=UPI003742AFF1